MTEEPRIELDLTARERRWYDRLRARVVERRPDEGSGVRDLMLLLPDAVVLLARLIRDPRVAPADKAIAVAGLAYVISPIDLIPEIIFGPLGLTDDLIIAGATLSRLLNRVHPDLLRYHWSGHGDAIETIQELTAWTERQISGLLRGRLGAVLRRLRR
jgi:uncharacterized membrane protein YkvA (DUF1232 family)